MTHEEDCREMFRKYRVIGFVAEHKTLWENLAFYCNCMLNFIIIVSYGVYLDEQHALENTCSDGSCDYKIELARVRMDEPRLFFNQSNDWTKDLLFFLGIVNLILSSLIFVFFFIKRAPILINDIWSVIFQYYSIINLYY